MEVRWLSCGKKWVKKETVTEMNVSVTVFVAVAEEGFDSPGFASYSVAAV